MVFLGVEVCLLNDYFSYCLWCYWRINDGSSGVWKFIMGRFNFVWRSCGLWFVDEEVEVDVGGSFKVFR